MNNFKYYMLSDGEITGDGCISAYDYEGAVDKLIPGCNVVEECNSNLRHGVCLKNENDSDFKRFTITGRTFCSTCDE